MCRNALKMFEMQKIAKPVKMFSRCASMLKRRKVALNSREADSCSPGLCFSRKSYFQFPGRGSRSH